MIDSARRLFDCQIDGNGKSANFYVLAPDVETAVKELTRHKATLEGHWEIVSVRGMYGKVLLAAI